MRISKEGEAKFKGRAVGIFTGKRRLKQKTLRQFLIWVRGIYLSHLPGGILKRPQLVSWKDLLRILQAVLLAFADWANGMYLCWNWNSTYVFG